MIQQKVVGGPVGKARGLFGFHIFSRFEGCDPSFLDNKELLLKTLYEAADHANMTPIGDLSKKFEPQGATVVLGLEESHISIHTWPEHGVAVVDVYTCGNEKSCVRAHEKLIEKIPHKKITNFSKTER